MSSFSYEHTHTHKHTTHGFCTQFILRVIYRYAYIYCVENITVFFFFFIQNLLQSIYCSPTLTHPARLRTHRQMSHKRGDSIVYHYLYSIRLPFGFIYAWLGPRARGNCSACKRFILRQKREKINIIVEKKKKEGKRVAAVGSNIPLPSAVNARIRCHCCLHLILISLRRCTAFRLNRRFVFLSASRFILLCWRWSMAK